MNMLFEVYDSHEVDKTCLLHDLIKTISLYRFCFLFDCVYFDTTLCHTFRFGAIW